MSQFLAKFLIIISLVFSPVVTKEAKAWVTFNVVLDLAIDDEFINSKPSVYLYAFTIGAIPFTGGLLLSKNTEGLLSIVGGIIVVASSLWLLEDKSQLNEIEKMVEQHTRHLNLDESTQHIFAERIIQKMTPQIAGEISFSQDEIKKILQTGNYSESEIDLLSHELVSPELFGKRL